MARNINPENPTERGQGPGERKGLGRADLGTDNTNYNKKYRPRLQVPYTANHIFLEVLSFATLAVLIGVFIFVMVKAPNLVPVHYGADGQVDLWGPKSNLWGPFIVGFIIYSALFVISRFPHALNYFVGITRENALKQYSLMRTFLTIIRGIAALLFAYILYSAYLVSINQTPARDLNIMSLIGVMVVTIFTYLLIAARNR